MTNQQRFVQKREANHTLHLILTICTCGLWGFVWIVAAMMGRKTVTTMPAQPMPPQGYYPPPTAQHQPYPPQYQAPPYYGPQGQQPPPPGQYGPPQR